MHAGTHSRAAWAGAAGANRAARLQVGGAQGHAQQAGGVRQLRRAARGRPRAPPPAPCAQPRRVRVERLRGGAGSARQPCREACGAERSAPALGKAGGLARAGRMHRLGRQSPAAQRMERTGHATLRTGSNRCTDPWGYQKQGLLQARPAHSATPCAGEAVLQAEGCAPAGRAGPGPGAPAAPGARSRAARAGCRRPRPARARSAALTPALSHRRPMGLAAICPYCKAQTRARRCEERMRFQNRVWHSL